jgi:hypothetical protein
MERISRRFNCIRRLTTRITFSSRSPISGVRIVKKNDECWPEKSKEIEKEERRKR